jgi:hypothetical protein
MWTITTPGVVDDKEMELRAKNLRKLSSSFNQSHGLLGRMRFAWLNGVL